MIGITTYLSIITLKVNGLNSLIKRQWLLDYVLENYHTTHCLKEWICLRKIFQANGARKQAGVAMFIWQWEFKAKLVTRDKKGNFILKKRTIHWEDITILNVYALRAHVIS
jgi:hypothetical protein